MPNFCILCANEKNSGSPSAVAGGWVCVGCYRRELAPRHPCDLCGDVAPVAAWLGGRALGMPLCARCYQTTVHVARCSACKNRRTIHTRIGYKPICVECYSLNMLIDSAGIGHVEKTTRLGRKIVRRTIANPDAIIGLGKESGEIEYAADTVTVAARYHMELENETPILFATAKNRYGRPSWSELRFNGYRFASPKDDDTLRREMESVKERKAKARAEKEAQRAADKDARAKEKATAQKNGKASTSTDEAKTHGAEPETATEVEDPDQKAWKL